MKNHAIGSSVHLGGQQKSEPVYIGGGGEEKRGKQLTEIHINGEPTCLGVSQNDLSTSRSVPNP